MLLSYLVGPPGRVTAFEPMEEAHSIAQKHADLNCHADTEVLRLALSDVDRPAADGFFNYSWHRDAGCDQERCTFAEIRLDTHLQYTERAVDFIKIDVDGYEFKLLRGAERVLINNQPILLLEVCDYTLRQALGPYQDDYVQNSQSREMLQYLQGLGYSFYREETDEPVSIEDALVLADLSRSSINLLCSTRPL